MLLLRKKPRISLKDWSTGQRLLSFFVVVLEEP